MSYEYHNERMCDKCGKEVGVDNLLPFPFIYKDMNDKHHKDEGDGYRQYYGCEECIAIDERINIRKESEQFTKFMEKHKEVFEK